ncbi:MAG: polyphosphate polymerase domain-containing protein [Bdellovibrionales bacterium]|nr:polyphosphate polymerase domain-containing protein [Bdellovibrionales bacterium]
MSSRYRHELKFIVPLGEADALFSDLLLYCDYDPHVTENKSYEIASIYYDTEDLRFYYDREESIGYRRKVRLRSYNYRGEATALFIEIKEKHQQYVLKKRILLRSMDILKTFELHDHIPLEAVIAEMEDCPEAREIEYLHNRLHLYPVVNIRYHRRPLIPKFENDMRITLDTRITAGGDNLGMYKPEQERSIIAPDLGVFEVKTNQSVPTWLQVILRRYNIGQTRYSKYCLGVDEVYGRGGRRWIQQLDSLEKKPPETPGSNASSDSSNGNGSSPQNSGKSHEVGEGNDGVSTMTRTALEYSHLSSKAVVGF